MADSMVNQPNACHSFMKLTILLAVLVLSPFVSRATPSDQHPNVLVIMPDDLSYSDFSFYNHQADAPRTPNIDRLAGESVRLTDFHVAPTCSPSRAQLMTGRYDDSCGVWHTIMGRYFLLPKEVTMADVFKANGYRTALFSKWHLGDSYPFRPKDRGFEHVVMIHGGGIDQQPSYWGSRNTIPSTLYDDDQPAQLTEANGSLPGEQLKPGASGAFTTNFFTTQAIDYMNDCHEKQEPFFVYLPYNVAHGPNDVPPDARPGIDAHTATIENLDKNIGRLLKFLETSGLADTTVLVFVFGDNGMANFMLRGDKATAYEAGHRVPCCIRWPDGGFAGTAANSREMPRLASEMDLLPTFIDLLHLRDVSNRTLAMDGISLKTALDADSTQVAPAWGTRVLVVDNQRLDDLVKYKQACVMRDELDAAGHVVHQWRAIRNSASEPWELYDIQSDLLERNNLMLQPANAHPGEILHSLQAAYESWWSQVSKNAGEYGRPIAGAAHDPTICLYAHDWHMTQGSPPWNHTLIADGLKANGFNAVAFAHAGDYTFDLRRWPREIAGETTVTSRLKSPIESDDNNAPLYGNPLPVHSARIRIWNGDKTYADERQDVKPDSSGAVFNLHLPPGPAMVQTWFYDSEGIELCGAYYVYVSRRANPDPSK